MMKFKYLFKNSTNISIVILLIFVCSKLIFTQYHFSQSVGETTLLVIIRIVNEQHISEEKVSSPVVTEHSDGCHKGSDFVCPQMKTFRSNWVINTQLF